MRFKKSIVLCLLFILCSCTNSGERCLGFDKSIEIKSRSIPINQVLQPRGWTVTDDKVIILSSNNDSMASVYHLPDFRYLYSGIRVGEGPGEITNMRQEAMHIYDENGNFTLFHSGMMRVYRFKAMDNGLISLNAKRMGVSKIKERRISLDSLLFDFSRNIYNPTDENVYMYMYDTALCGIVDSVGTQALFLPQRGEYQNFPTIIVKDKQCVVVYSDTGRVEYYDFSTGRLVLRKAIGDHTPVANLKPIDYDSYDGPFYVYAAADGDFIYILQQIYNGDKGPDCYILVYNWEGEAIKKCHLDKVIHNLIAWKGNVYGYDERQDFEQVYTYDLN